MNQRILEQQLLIAIRRCADSGMKSHDVAEHLASKVSTADVNAAKELTDFYFAGSPPLRCSDELRRVAKVVTAAKAEGVFPSRVVDSWLDSGMHEEGSRGRNSLVNTILYSACMLLVLSLVLTIFREKVYPIMSDAILETGGTPPALTQILLEPNALQAAMIGLAILGCALFLALMFFLVRGIEKKASPPAWLLKLPYYGRLAARFAACEWLRVRILLDDSLGDIKAGDLAAQLSGFNPQSISRDHMLGSFIGLSSVAPARELFSGIRELANLGLERAVRTSTIVIMTITAIFVGVCVMAMYLPIFMLGKSV